MAQYHPSEDLLAGYASGAVDEQTEALIAAHLTFCPACRRMVTEHEAIAGALLERESAPSASVAGVAAILNASPSRAPSTFNEPPLGTLSKIAPQPLARYVYEKTGEADTEGLNWTFYGPGIKRAILVGDEKGALVRLIKAEPGAVFPDHGHGSDELTLVLTGAYRDQTGRYATGDVQCAPAELSHQPIVEDDGVCFAFVVSEKPANPKNITAKIVQRLIGR